MSSPPPPADAAASSCPAKSTSEENNLLDTIHLLLGSKLRITMTDGRFVTGKFICLDRLCNVTLENVVEHRRLAYISPSESGEGDEQKLYQWDTERTLSQAVIPGSRLAKIEISKGEFEARVVQSSNPEEKV